MATADFFLRSYHRQVRQIIDHEVRQVNQEWLQSLLEGFDLIQNRVRRVLKSEAIEPIACLGLPVDPERMIVIDTTDSTGRPSGTVVDELRRGYTWKGRILRLAEVRAVRGMSQGRGEHEEPAHEDDPPLLHLEVDEPSGDNGSRVSWLETD